MFVLTPKYTVIFFAIRQAVLELWPDNLSQGDKEDIEKEKLVEPCWHCNFEPRKNLKICDFWHFWKPKCLNAAGIPQILLYHLFRYTSRIVKMILDPWNTIGVPRYPITKMQF